MKKKVLYGVALTLFAGTTMGTLQSCKDDLSDLRQEVVYNQGDMVKKLDALKTALEAQIAACGSSCDAKIQALQAQINTLTAEIAKKADKDDVDAKITGLNTLIGTLQSTINSLQASLADKADKTEVAAIEAQITALQNLLASTKTDLENLINGKADAATVNSAIANLQSQIDALKNKADQSDVDDLKNAIAAIQSQINDILAGNGLVLQEIADLKAKIAELEGQIADKTVVDQIKDDLDRLEDDLEQYKQDANSYADAIKSDLEEKIAALAAQLAGLSSSINADIVAINTRIDLLSADYSQQFADINTEINNIRNSYIDLNDKYTQLASDLVTIKTNYETQQAIIDELNKNLDALAQDVFGPAGLSDQLSQVRQELKDDINELSLKYTEIAASNTELWESIFGEGGLTTQMSQYYNANKEAIEELSKDQQDLWEKIFAPGGLSDQMSQYYNANKDEIEANAKAIAENKDAILANKEEIEKIKNSTNELWESIYGDGGLTTIISQMFMANQEEINELRASNTELWESIYGEGGLTTLMSQYYNANKEAIEEVASDLADVKTSLNNLIGRVDALITGILLQATDNPVFGNFSLPMGVKNNMLFNWYGYNSSLIKKFPSNSNSYSYNDELAGVDFNALGAPFESVQQGFLSDVNLGRVYLTVNPIGHNFDNTKFTLETSAGKPLPFGLKVSKSDAELYFGYTRAENGFYAADVVISGDQAALNKGIEATKLTIDDNLKSAVKEVLNDRSKRSALNLLKAVYGQMSNQLPAYAVRYDWNVDGKNYAVLSNYDLAVASAKPLSYQFFYGQSISKKLPTIGHIDNIINELKGQFKIDFTPISFENIKIQLPPIDLSTVNVTPGETTVTTELDPIKITIDGEDHYSDRIPVTIDINDVVGSITKQFNDAINDMTKEIKDWSSKANDKISADLQEQLKPIADQINGMVEDINGQIDKIIDDMADKAQPYFDKLNRVVDLYNKVAGKINDVLDDPNQYLQVAMFYRGGKAGVNILSNSKNSPTVFNAGNGYVGLYASSYSAELVAPAFKKYVAVSNVYKKDPTTKKIEVAPNAADLMAKVNGKNHFNEVMDGNTIRYSIPAENLEKGLIYEIVYQGLDFHGVTSTQKFYITVK